MRKTWMMGTALAVAVAISACGDDRDADTAIADSLDRDLQLAPVDTTATLGEPTTTPPATGGQTAQPAAPRQQAPRQQTQAPAAPSGGTQTSSAMSLGAGTEFTAVTTSQISSGTNKQGDIVTATVGTAVKDSRGRVVIPAGSELRMRIAAIRESENKSDQTGTLTLEPTEVVIGGQSYPLVASISSLETQLVDRGTNVGDVAKVGGGAAAGAVVGRVLGGSTKGAVIGGIIGGAVGAQRAVETQDRDVVVPEGTTMTLRLSSTFSRG
jgi:hypothetical protein